MGSAGEGVGPSGVCTVSYAAQEVAVTSPDDAPPDGEDEGDPAVGRCVLYALSRGVCHQRAKGRCAIPVSELGDVSREICGESAHLTAAHRPLGWPPRHLSLSLS